MTGYVQEFGSFEDALDYMAKATDQANAHLAPEQAALTYGCTWARFDHLVEPSRLLIVGKVDTLAEIIAGEIEAYGDDEDAAREDGFASVAEAGQHAADNSAANHERGYLFGRAYSVIEPRGELGDTHRANAWPISPELFEALLAAECKIDVLAETDQHRADELYQAFAAWRAHELAKARAGADTENPEVKPK
jgi:hypothetical protein